MDEDIKKIITDLRSEGQLHGQIESLKVKSTSIFFKKLELMMKEFEGSVNRNAISSNSLARKIFWLNCILTLATAVGTFVYIWEIFFKK